MGKKLALDHLLWQDDGLSVAGEEVEGGKRGLENDTGGMWLTFCLDFFEFWRGGRRRRRFEEAAGGGVGQ